MKTMRKIIEIDEELCDGCGNCVTACEEGAIQIIDGKARVVNDMFCDGLGACIGDCPPGALTIVEREAEAFNEKAVEIHLARMNGKKQAARPMACGCPSTNIQTFIPAGSCQAANRPTELSPAKPAATAAGRMTSTLSNWPIQINLIPPQAPFLKGADLLLAADCVPASYPNFHQDFLKGRKLLLGCPKLDNAEAYVQKLAAIFQNAGIRSLTVVIMEVPCCSGLPMIVKRAMEVAGADIPVEEITVSIREGEILERVRN